MNRRFGIICLVIGLGLLSLSVLGLSSLGMHEKGMRAERQQEFIAVAEQIRFDVKKKLDTFNRQEQERPYTDYQYFYVPEANRQTPALVRTPLADSLANGLAYGYFQLDSTGNLVTPYYIEGYNDPSTDVQRYVQNLTDNLLPSLDTGASLQVNRIEPPKPAEEEDKAVSRLSRRSRAFEVSYVQSNADYRAADSAVPVSDVLDKQEYEAGGDQTVKPPVVKDVALKVSSSGGAVGKKGISQKMDNTRRSTYRIPLEQNEQTQVMVQSRANVELNFDNTAFTQPREGSESMGLGMDGLRQQTAAEPQAALQEQSVQNDESGNWRQRQEGRSSARFVNEPQGVQSEIPPSVSSQAYKFQASDSEQTHLGGSSTQFQTDMADVPGERASQKQFRDFLESLLTLPGMDDTFNGLSFSGYLGNTTKSDTVQIRIEPFVPMTVPEENGQETIFAGQVFLLRHVQIEDRHLLQGFRLNENELLNQIHESARRLLHTGMGYEVSRQERADAVYTAILDFGFGEVVLNLLELQPGLIQGRVDNLRNWFYGILGVVWLAVVVALAALWRNMYEQVQLSRKKDDFISAVSHELRTPLTSIRMYTEMLEKDWVKTDEKRREYYTTMRQESERLTRLVENVLDFSRIQRGKKQYDFAMGDVNQCIREVSEMMTPYIQRAGFVLEQDFGPIAPFAFDRDAVVQIVINLLDNALKYAKDSDDKRILLRTRTHKNFAVIEVEDRGPGVPRNQQKKIFEAFYRCGDESTRQTTGTGLGLALVKRFAQAHHGFVEILNARPSGAIFRVGLAV